LRGQEKFIHRPAAAVAVSDEVSAPGTQRQAKEIGSAFDDIVDHPIMGRE
jgi:hypothetical protein